MCTCMSVECARSCACECRTCQCLAFNARVAYTHILRMIWVRDGKTVVQQQYDGCKTVACSGEVTRASRR
eukprot:m.147239 g.147239  ORF g.147239 m.147239 type:complete len:70 (+) comp30522_c0_seq4:88-297(+)